MNITNGLVLLILGMSGVFTILTVMFTLIKTVIFFDSKIKPKKREILPAKQSILKKAGIIATLHHHKKKIEGKNG